MIRNSRCEHRVARQRKDREPASSFAAAVTDAYGGAYKALVPTHPPSAPSCSYLFGSTTIPCHSAAVSVTGSECFDATDRTSCVARDNVARDMTLRGIARVYGTIYAGDEPRVTPSIAIREKTSPSRRLSFSRLASSTYSPSAYSRRRRRP